MNKKIKKQEFKEFFKKQILTKEEMEKLCIILNEGSTSACKTIWWEECLLNTKRNIKEKGERKYEK